MNILLISECKGAALKETRRIIDQFAERTGQRSWQTAITEAGLNHLHKLLRKTARRNSAISCYWTRGQNHTELLWVVGNRRHFNERGRVPIRTTRRKIPSAGEEQSWPLGEVIQITAAIAALLHDLGKATVGFQKKLHNSIDRLMSEPDPYRHEWVSLLLFLEMVKGCESNQALLERLANFGAYREANIDWHRSLIRKIAQKEDPLSHLNLLKIPPLGRFIGWLIVTHHRMVQVDSVDRSSSSATEFAYPIDFFWQNFTAYDQWVHNANSPFSPQNNREKFAQFITLQSDITASPHWQKSLSRWANRGLKNRYLIDGEEGGEKILTFTDPLLLYLSRLTLITGDHNYSALPFEASQRREVSAPSKEMLIANLDRESQSSPLLNGGKQSLEAHLLGVTEETVKFAHLLPKLRKGLPRLKEHKPFQRRTKLKRFKWQDRIYDLLKSEQRVTERQGFFGISMASTGCGKTIGNAKMAAALSGEQGARFTIALGLRTLTQQTAESLKEALELNSEMIATLIGGESVAIRQRLEEQWEKDQGKSAKAETIGSESAHQFEAFETAELLGGMEEGLFSTAGGYVVDAAESHWIADSFATLMRNQNDRKLLKTPIIACTIDHLMAASESARGGRHIVPLLRLFSADLILDEPDDFALEDLPALSRLLYLCGLMGGRVILSSATLSPDFVAGLFTAYQEGRSIWNQHQQLGEASKDIVVAWVDEAAEKLEICKDVTQFRADHKTFVAQRVAMLSELPIKRQATIIPWEPPSAQDGEIFNIEGQTNREEERWRRYYIIAKTILKEALNLHQTYHEVAPKESGYNEERVSIGLVRLSKITHIIPLAEMVLNRAFWRILKEEAPELFTQLSKVKIHLNVYHSRQILLLRSLLESKLDRILLRKEPLAIFKQPEIKRAILGGESMQKDHLFIVLGSPVTEVGRDHDYDWAILEPSSHRSIVQLAGRVWRHRDRKLTAPNLALLSEPIATLLCYGIKTIKEHQVLAQKKKNTFYHRPGFESSTARLCTHHLPDLIPGSLLRRVDSKVRIMAPEKILISDFQRANSGDHHPLTIPQKSCVRYRTLASLEHGELRRLLQPELVGNFANAVNSFWRQDYPYHHLYHLQRHSPFRQSLKEEIFLFLPSDEAESGFNIYHAETLHQQGGRWYEQLTALPTQNYKIQIDNNLLTGNNIISPWLVSSLDEGLEAALGGFVGESAEDYTFERLKIARRFASVSLKLLKFEERWVYNPFYGFSSERVSEVAK